MTQLGDKRRTKSAFLTTNLAQELDGHLRGGSMATETLKIRLGAFHWAHGITFQRQNERGDVILGFGGLTFTVPAEQWCSIIASVTPAGDNAETYAAAKQFHG